MVVTESKRLKEFLLPDLIDNLPGAAACKALGTISLGMEAGPALCGKEALNVLGLAAFAGDLQVSLPSQYYSSPNHKY